MPQLLFAYLAVGGSISALLVLARGNRKQGWRRRRGVWRDVQAEAALRAVKAPSVTVPFQHLDDLGRLHQALVAQGLGQAPAPVEKPLKANVLA